MVSITYGHWQLYDFNITDAALQVAWKEHEDGSTGTYTIYMNDQVKLNVPSTPAPTGNKIYYIYNDANLTADTDQYTKIVWRCKTAGGSVKAKIALEFSDTDTQTVLAETSTNGYFKAGSATITSGKILDHIRLHANGGTGSVYYDFVLVCKGTFTFPNAPRISLNPLGRDAILEPPSRYGDIDQTLGNKSATVDITCDLDVGTKIFTDTAEDWKRPQGIDPATSKPYVKTDKVNGQVFLDIWHNRGTEPWQWLSFNGFSFKAKLASCPFEWSGDSHSLPLTFREYRLSSASGETVVERLGLNNP